MIARRKFLVITSAAALVVRDLFAKAAVGTPHRILLGTGGWVSKGIYTADWNPSTGELGEITLAAEVASPTFLAITAHNSGHFVYAVTEAGRTDSTLTAFTTLPGQKELRKLNEVPSKGG